MIALLVTIDIQPEFKERFIEELLLDAKGANDDEPGCLRFDVIQDSEDPNRIHLYEVYKDDAAIAAHREAPHFVKWRDTTKDWLAKPYSRTLAFAPTSIPQTKTGARGRGPGSLLYLHLDKCELFRVRIYHVVLDAGVSEVGLADLELIDRLPFRRHRPEIPVHDRDHHVVQAVDVMPHLRPRSETPLQYPDPIVVNKNC